MGKRGVFCCLVLIVRFKEGGSGVSRHRTGSIVGFIWSVVYFIVKSFDPPKWAVYGRYVLLTCFSILPPLTFLRQFSHEVIISTFEIARMEFGGRRVAGLG